MRNDLTIPIKDTSHSCIFDFPDNAVPPLPPPPTPAGDPPNCYPYCPSDDWPPISLPPPPPIPPVVPPVGTVVHGTGFTNGTVTGYGGAFPPNANNQLTLNGVYAISSFADLTTNIVGKSWGIIGGVLDTQYDDFVMGGDPVGVLTLGADGQTPFRNWNYISLQAGFYVGSLSRISSFDYPIVEIRLTANLQMLQFPPNPSPPEVIDPFAFSFRIQLNNRHAPYSVIYTLAHNTGDLQYLIARFFYNQINGALSSYVTLDDIQQFPN
jgi:hypothetical protein